MQCSEVGGSTWVVSDADGPGRGGARQRSEPGRADGLVNGQEGLQGGRVRVAGERHLTQDVRQATEEDGRAGVPTAHLLHERRLVLLSTHPHASLLTTTGSS